MYQDVLQVFQDVLQVFQDVLQVFNNVFRCLVSCATIGDCTATNYLRDRYNATEICYYAAGIGDNSAEVSNDAAWIVDIAAKVIPC